ncbi:MAG: DUF2057 family protein [Thioalkalispiraceae bacterium]|jgi:uncharacterized protein YccT (UPF0319 family)
MAAATGIETQRVCKDRTVKIQYTLLFLIALSALQACSTVSGPVHVYEGPARPASETARLRVPGPVSVKKIDGKKIKVPSIEEGFYEIVLLPGVHRIDFKYELAWGDNVSGMLVKSDVVGVETRFFAGKHYELTYAIPNGQEEAFEMALDFKAKLVEKETGRLVASRSTAELDAFRITRPVEYRAMTDTQTVQPGATVAGTAGVVPADINAQTAAQEDAVKRLKFWWLMANEQERKQFREWMQSVDGAVSDN